MLMISIENLGYLTSNVFVSFISWLWLEYMKAAHARTAAFDSFVMHLLRRAAWMELLSRHTVSGCTYIVLVLCGFIDICGARTGPLLAAIFFRLTIA